MVSGASRSPKPIHAITAVRGGTRYRRLATRDASPRRSSMYSTIVAPIESTSTDQPRVAAMRAVHSIGRSSIHQAAAPAAAPATASCTVVLVTRSICAHRLFW